MEKIKFSVSRDKGGLIKFVLSYYEISILLFK